VLDSLNRSVVLAGAMMCLLIAVPAVIVVELLSDGDNDDPSNWTFLALIAIVIAYLLGGALAGRAIPNAPFINGAAATLLAFVLVQGLFIVLRLLRDDDVNVIAFVFNGLLAASIGIVGGWFGARWASRTLAAGGGEPTG
jgi:putative membrane protein (TIGR04086 family)